MKRLKIIVASLALFIGLNGALPSMAMADTAKNTVCTALGSDATCSNDPHGSSSLNNIITLVINILSWVVGITAVIMLIIGGFRFVTANGDSNSVAAARNTIIYALVGLVIAASAQVIVKFVIHQTTTAPAVREQGKQN